MLRSCDARSLRLPCFPVHPPGGLALHPLIFVYLVGHNEDLELEVKDLLHNPHALLGKIRGREALAEGAAAHARAERC